MLLESYSHNLHLLQGETYYFTVKSLQLRNAFIVSIIGMDLPFCIGIVAKIGTSDFLKTFSITFLKASLNNSIFPISSITKISLFTYN